MALNAISSGRFCERPQSDRADQEDHEADLEHDLAPVLVAELAVQRRHDRLGEQVGRDDPGEVVEAAEVADDRRQRRRDDRAVERGEQHHEHEAREDDVDVRGLRLLVVGSAVAFAPASLMPRLVQSTARGRVAA